MLPFLEVGPFVLSTFRLTHLLALLLGAALLRVRLARRSAAQVRLWPGLAGSAGVGGVLGARLWGALERNDPGSWFEQPLGLTSGGSWLGGLAGATLLAFACWRAHSPRPDFLDLADSAAPCAAFGLTIARLGCFLSGDSCHGVPSDLPWAIAYPRGLSPTLVTVHPTELYEGLASAALGLTLVLLPRRDSPPGLLVSLFLLVSGLVRLFVEELRGHPVVAFGLTAAQAASALFLLGGAIALLFVYRTPSPERPRPVISQT